MSGLEVNKILASIILAIIVVVIISLIGNLIINRNFNDKDKNAYLIDTSDIDENNQVASSNTSKVSESISLILANASIEKGGKLFKKCSACHTYTKEGANKVGPSLWNIVNRPKANVEGFGYSKDLAEFGGKWGYEALNNFLHKPKEYIPGTKMNFSGIKKVQDRANLILFLREQSETPAELP